MMGAQNMMSQAARSGGYDSDVEGANSAYQNAAAMGSSFGDKAVRKTLWIKQPRRSQNWN